MPLPGHCHDCAAWSHGLEVAPGHARVTLDVGSASRHLSAYRAAEDWVLLTVDGRLEIRLPFTDARAMALAILAMVGADADG